MMINRRLFLGGSASVAAMAALAACAKSSDPGASGASDGSQGAAQAMNLQERSALQEGGELKLSLTATIANWNYSHVDGNGVDTRNIWNFVNPYTLDWGDDGSPTPNPNFLTKLEATEEGGKTVVTVAVNEKAVWGNGRNWDSEDIKEGLVHGTDEAYLWASADGYDQIENVEIVDNLTAKVTFKSVFPDWSNMFSGFSPKELMATPETFNEAMAGEDNFNNDYFSGPFKVDSFDKSQQVVTLVPNDKWWGDKPLLEKVTFRVLDASAEATAFANKTLDVIDYIIAADVYEQCIGRDDAEVRQNFGLQWRHFTLNGTTGPLADKAVRQALLRACNREAIAQSDLVGLPVDISKVLLGNRFFMPNQEGYQDNSTQWGYDVEAAKKLLDEAGWTEGADGIREKDGQRLTISFTMPAGVQTTENEANLLQAQVKEAGMEITLNPVDTNGYFKDYIRPGNFELTAFTWNGTQYPMANIGQIYGSGSNQNYSGISVPQIDEYIQQIATTADKEERFRLTNEVDKLIWENVMNFPMYERLQLTAVPKTLANFGANGLASYRAENIGFMKG
ncbi:MULTISPECIES: ABC transporter family substrate-binding protein [Actinomyces]|uniref:ABC transporter family substrate-binding protein n=1 Tax=Actinomyces respiraculi TaxID=2744574 RepID=A0A7T0LL28_9ACTO|nr:MULTISPECIES: ABC transporter family substrate-binding protein [Actinomyces]QPL05734.1 ABC transporter family substrate-binding protein [Actinomyces respiraculi]